VGERERFVLQIFNENRTHPALARVPSADSAPTQTVGRLSRTPVRMHREVLYPHATRPGPLEVFPCDGGSSRAHHHHHWLRRVGVHCW
jgi:hypothetical protein